MNFNDMRFIAFLILLATLTTFYVGSFLYLYNIEFENDLISNIYSYSYGIIAIVGSVLGIISSGRWGYHKSLVGMALVTLSLGLLMQGLGQFTYTYLVLVVQTEDLYPSIAEIFFVASIILYIIGSFYLATVVGVTRSLKDMKTILISFTLAVFLLFFAYYKFITEHDDTMDSNALLILLEIFYPFGQSLFVFFAFLGLLLIKNIAKGKMASHVFLIFMGLLAQFFADTLYSKVPEQLSDMLYISSYVLMASALLYFGRIPKLGQISSNNKRN